MKTICITLMEQPERTEAAKKHFEEMGVTDVKFYEGLNGQIMGFETTHPYMRDRQEGDELFFIGPKPTGIFLSHYSLWSALTLLPDEHFMILESDAMFHEGWKEKYDELIGFIPADFDWLFLGSCCAENIPKYPLGSDLYELRNNRWPMCFHAYIVAKKALKHLLATNRDCFAPIDISVTLNCFKELKVLTVYPRIVSQFNTDIPA